MRGVLVAQAAAVEAAAGVSAESCCVPHASGVGSYSDAAMMCCDACASVRRLTFKAWCRVVLPV